MSGTHCKFNFAKFPTQFKSENLLSLIPKVID